MTKPRKHVNSAHRPSGAVEYVGKRTKTGNSSGFRFEGAFFKSHPEFSGEVRAHVIAPGRLLVTAEPMEGQESDPIIASFLAFLNQHMMLHPTDIHPLDDDLSQKIATLVERVEVANDEDLGDEALL